jgi:hypothetical protein
MDMSGRLKLKLYYMALGAVLVGRKMKQENSSEGNKLFFHDGEFYDNAFFLFK